ncbi:MAG: hypothetical protein IJ346_01220 [Clostridia bacterium]|nr:hypothetical protein [Clostridia bacterium]
MNDKKDLLLSTIQLITVLTGAAITTAIGYPQGIFFLLPLCAAPLSEIYKIKKHVK